MVGILFQVPSKTNVADAVSCNPFSYNKEAQHAVIVWLQCTPGKFGATVACCAAVATRGRARANAESEFLPKDVPLPTLKQGGGKRKVWLPFWDAR